MTEDFLPINGTDYVELYVGNAKQSALYYQYAFGFELIAYAGPETGVKDRASYVLKQEKIRLVLTSPLSSDHPITTHIKQHRSAKNASGPEWRSSGSKHPNLWRHHTHFRGTEKLPRSLPTGLPSSQK